MYGQNPWGMGYPPQPQYIYYPPQYPPQPGVQPISTSDQAFELAKKMRKDEKKAKKAWDAENNKKKEGDKKPEKLLMDNYFATKAEVVFFMWLVSPGIAVMNWVLLKYLFEHFV